MLVFEAHPGIHKTLFRIANREDPDQAAALEAVSVIWVCTVCLGLFGMVFEIL